MGGYARERAKQRITEISGRGHDLVTLLAGVDRGAEGHRAALLGPLLVHA
jgi:hypothetical protein